MDEQGKRRFGMDDEEVKVLDMFAAAAVGGLLSRMDIIDEEECREGDFPNTSEYGVAEVAYRIAGQCLKYRRYMIDCGQYGENMR